MILLLLLLVNYTLISAAPANDKESGWWNMLSSHVPLWYSHEENPDDNDEVIKNSVKLMELFPTLKEKLESSDEKEKEEAIEFIAEMNSEIKKKKRYTYMLWKGVRTFIDMGRVESKERRSNEKQVNIIWRFLQGIVDIFKTLFGLDDDDDEQEGQAKDKDNKHEHDKSTKSSNESTKEHDKEHNHPHIVPTHHSTPPSDPNAGVKDEYDNFEGKPTEIIHEDHSAMFHIPVSHQLPPSDPKARTKDQFDRFDGKTPQEVIRD